MQNSYDNVPISQLSSDDSQLIIPECVNISRVTTVNPVPSNIRERIISNNTNSNASNTSLPPYQKRIQHQVKKIEEISCNYDSDDSDTENSSLINISQTIKVMDILYNTNFSIQLRSEQNIATIGHYLKNNINNSENENNITIKKIVNVLNWMMQDWKIENISKIIIEITSGWKLNPKRKNDSRIGRLVRHLTVDWDPQYLAHLVSLLFSSHPLFNENAENNKEYKEVFLKVLSKKWKFCRLSQFFICLGNKGSINHKLKMNMLQRAAKFEDTNHRMNFNFSNKNTPLSSFSSASSSSSSINTGKKEANFNKSQGNSNANDYVNVNASTSSSPSPSPSIILHSQNENQYNRSHSGGNGNGNEPSFKGNNIQNTFVLSNEVAPTITQTTPNTTNTITTCTTSEPLTKMASSTSNKNNNISQVTIVPSHSSTTINSSPSSSSHSILFSQPMNNSVSPSSSSSSMTNSLQPTIESPKIFLSYSSGNISSSSTTSLEASSSCSTPLVANKPLSDMFSESSSSKTTTVINSPLSNKSILNSNESLKTEEKVQNKSEVILSFNQIHEKLLSRGSLNTTNVEDQYNCTSSNSSCSSCSSCNSKDISDDSFESASTLINDDDDNDDNETKLSINNHTILPENKDFSSHGKEKEKNDNEQEYEIKQNNNKNKGKEYNNQQKCSDSIKENKEPTPINFLFSSSEKSTSNPLPSSSSSSSSSSSTSSPSSTSNYYLLSPVHRTSSTPYSSVNNVSVPIPISSNVRDINQNVSKSINLENRINHEWKNNIFEEKGSCSLRTGNPMKASIKNEKGNLLLNNNPNNSRTCSSNEHKTNDTNHSNNAYTSSNSRAISKSIRKQQQQQQQNNTIKSHDNNDKQQQTIQIQINSDYHNENCCCCCCQNGNNCNNNCGMLKNSNENIQLNINSRNVQEYYLSPPHENGILGNNHISLNTSNNGDRTHNRKEGLNNSKQDQNTNNINNTNTKIINSKANDNINANTKPTTSTKTIINSNNNYSNTSINTNNNPNTIVINLPNSNNRNKKNKSSSPPSSSSSSSILEDSYNSDSDIEDSTSYYNEIFHLDDFNSEEKKVIYEIINNSEDDVDDVNSQLETTEKIRILLQQYHKELSAISSTPRTPPSSLSSSPCY